jgi:DNA-binding CsgD family transcriptional regulator/PAS domain-containing protein
MQQDRLLSALIGDIYDAALDPGRWQNVLASVARFVGGASATLFSKTGGRPPGLLLYEYGIEPPYRRLYIDQYIKLDPAPTTGHYTRTGAATTRRIFSEVGQPIAATDLISPAGFFETRFYREWAHPQGVVDFVGAVLDNSVESAAMFGVFRHKLDGPTDAGARRRMRLIVPHIRRALLVSRLIAARTFEAETLAVAFDGLKAGVIVLETNADIVYANLAGHELLRTGDMLRIVGGRLAATDMDSDRMLREVIAAADSGHSPSFKDTTLPLVAHDGRHYVTHVLPLAPTTRSRAEVCPAKAVALIVHRAALDKLASEAIAKVYRLTPRELRVLLSLVEVGGVPDVARVLGISEATVRTHVARLFDKTGVSRQVDLVKIVAGFTNPLLVG